MSSLSAASSILLHAFLLLAAMIVVVSTTASSSVPVTGHRGVVNMTRFTNASSVEAPPNWEMYRCFLCTGRHPLLIHYCPIYWDECHLDCWFDIDPEAPAPPAPPLPTSSTSQGSSSSPADSMDTVQGLECYVMKVYESGRYVIVQRLDCDVVVKSGCFLTCGGGELDDQKVAMGTTAVPATIQGPPSELCNSQVNALRAPLSSAAAGGVVVPAGGAH